MKYELLLFLQFYLDFPVILQDLKTRDNSWGYNDNLGNCLVSYALVGVCLWGVYASMVSSSQGHLLCLVCVYGCACVCLQACGGGLPFCPGVWVRIYVFVHLCSCLRCVFALSGIILCQCLSLVGSIIAQVPGLQWYVAIQDPAVMQMNRILGTGWGSWSGWAGLAAGSHWSPLKRVSRWGWLPGTGAGVRRRRRRREGSEGELVVWAALHV